MSYNDFKAIIMQADNHPYPCGKYPYFSLWKTRFGRIDGIYELSAAGQFDENEDAKYRYYISDLHYTEKNYFYPIRIKYKGHMFREVPISLFDACRDSNVVRGVTEWTNSKYKLVGLTDEQQVSGDRFYFMKEKSDE